MTQIKTITSPQNPIFKDWLKLEKSSGIESLNKIIISGEKIIQDYLNEFGTGAVSEMIFSESTSIEKFKKWDLTFFSVSKNLFNLIDFLNTKQPLLVIHKPTLKKWDPRSEANEIEIFLPLQDPNNLGALIRSSTAFGARKIVLLSESAHPFLPKSIRASSGTVFSAPLFLGPSIKELKNYNLKNLYALDLDGENLVGFSWPQHIQILVGEEGPGIPADLDIKTLSIPISKTCESLNASIAASIALYSYRSKFPLKS